MEENQPTGDTPPNESTDQPPIHRRLTVREAAEELGISEAAVRNRVSRGTLQVEREEGAVYVLLEADESAANRGESADQPNDEPAGESRLIGDESQRYADQSELIAVLREQLAAERKANEENRRIIAGLVQRIPELEAPPASGQEAEDVAESATTEFHRPEATERPTEPQAGRRPWWRRLFGG